MMRSLLASLLVLLAVQARAEEPVAAMGVINTVDVAAGSVNLSHEPIPDIGWPAMTMDLALSDSVDLAGIEAGSGVLFTLEKGPDGIYRIGTIEAADHAPMPVAMERHGGHH
jgi:Cu/Ag efflux protein CusF